jgi:hypothetical protein
MSKPSQSDPKSADRGVKDGKGRARRSRMKKDREQKSASGESASAKAPTMLLAVAWLVPGLGHWILGKRRRAIVFAVIICCAFVTGVLIDGELGVPRHNHPFSWLATLACVGNGILYLGRLLWLNGFGGLFSGTFPFDLLGGGDPVAVGFSYGNTFLYTGGLMNLLTVLDVSDIARGEKD